MREYEYYCSKCGRQVFLYDHDSLKCDCCNSELIESPHEYDLTRTNWRTLEDEHWEQLEQRFFDEVISKSPEFDQYLYNHKEEILAEESAKMNTAIVHGKAVLEEASKILKCPTCQSTNIRKMGAIESGASIMTFGIFSRKINKTFKCNNCGCIW